MRVPHGKFFLEAYSASDTIRANMRISIYLKTAAAVIAASICSNLFSEPVRLAGSDLVAAKIGKAVDERAKERSIDLKTNMIGTRQAMMDLQKGDADIAIIAMPDGQKKLEGYQYVPYANQIAVILVNTANPIEEISTTQLRQIFGTEAVERGDSWQNYGSTIDSTAIRNIVPITTSLKESLALEIFKYKCIDGANVSLKVETKDSTPILAQAVKNSSNAIGIASYDPHLEGVKVLAVSNSGKNAANIFAFKPTSENVHNGDYPLSLNFAIVFKQENAEKIKPIIQVLFDDNTINLLEKGGMMPAPRNFIRSYLLGLDIDK